MFFFFLSLSLSPSRAYPELELRRYGISEGDKSSVPLSGIFYGSGGEMSVSELIGRLEQTYCGAMAAEFEHLKVSFQVSCTIT